MATTNPLHQGGITPQILMAAVLRQSDKTVVAVYNVSKDVTKEGIRECVAGNGNIQTGKRYTTEGDKQSIHYTLDAQGRVYALVTNKKYPTRVAFLALEELQKQFGKELGPRVPNAIEDSLNRPARPVLKGIVDRFTDPAAEDKLTEITGKVDVVKTVMKDNIAKILENEAKLENIEAASVALNEKAMDFKKGTKELSDKMWWKMWKMRLLIGGLIVAVLLIIIVPAAVSAQSSSSSS